MDALVVGVGNTNEYFSKPFVFLSLLPLLVVGSEQASLRNWSNQRHHTIFWVSAAVATSLVAVFFDEIGIGVPFASGITNDLLSDSRLLFCLVMVGALTMRSSRREESVPIATSVLYIVVASVGIFPTIERLASDGVRPNISETEMNVLIGPPDARTVALWLRENSARQDIVATNYLRDKYGEFDNDYSLAAWSRREFLVLGPSLSFSSVSTDEAIRWSEEFGRLPSAESAAYLKSQDVKWYIVDLDKTPVRSWEPFAETVVMTWRFWVLRLR
jgi:hypothetical protein